MRRFFFVVVATLLGVMGNGVTASAAITQDINQHPIGGSGIQGRIEVTDTGSTLVIHGTASGLNPRHAYFSLIYTTGSHPGGPAEGATLPSTSNAIAPCDAFNQAGTSTIDFAQMLVGFWRVNSDGTGALDAVKSGPGIGNSQEAFWPTAFVDFIKATFGFVPHSNSYAAIGTWSTMSIRDASLNFALQACGEAQGTGSGRA